MPELIGGEDLSAIKRQVVDPDLVEDSLRSKQFATVIDLLGYGEIDSILDEVYTFGVGIKWFGLSWRNDLGLRLKQNYPKNFIPIYLNDKEYVSLEDTIVDDHTEFNTWHYEDKNNLRLSDTIHGVKDTHLSSIGHEVVAKSILRKIK